MIKIEIRDQNEQILKKLQLNNVLPGKGVTIGRSPECGIVLRDHSVSRQHAQLKSDEGQLFIVDLGSSGGTFVNGNFLAPNQRTHLSSGDVCRCGSLDLVISLLDSEQHEDGGEATRLVESLPLSFQPLSFVKANSWESWDGGKIKLTCTNTYDETHDVKTFIFVAQPNTLFRYQPGQFATLHLTIDGTPATRSYTISSTPSRPHSLAFTIKRVPATGEHAPGLVSNWLHDHFKVGDTLDISGPFGDFSCHRHPAEKLCLISGGSGITPMLSMTRWLCDSESKVDTAFVHLAKTEADLISRHELETFSERYANLNLVFALSRCAANSSWAGLRGRLSADMLKMAVPDITLRRIFVCGPMQFMAAIKQQLEEIEFPMERYHEESFGGRSAAALLSQSTISEDTPRRFGLKAILEKVNGAEGREGSKKPRIAKKTSSGTVPETSAGQIVFKQSGVTVSNTGMTLLEIAEEAGLSLPFACRQGICGACKQVKLSGKLCKTEYDDSILSESDKEAGHILLCTAKAAGDIEVNC